MRSVSLLGAFSLFLRGFVGLGKLLVQGADDLVPQMGEEEEGDKDAHHLRDGEGPPHGVEIPGPGQQPGHRDEHHQLAGDGNKHAVSPLAQRLESAAEDDAEAGGQEGDAHRAQGGDADGHHIVAGVEQAEKHPGNELHERKAQEHEGDGIDDGGADGLVHPVGAAGPVVIGQDRDEGVVEPEYRHEDKALELEIHTEHRHGSGGKDDEHPVHAIGHHRADGGHDDGGDPHAEDAADHSAWAGSPGG